MKARRRKRLSILVIDVGGSHVKCLVTGRRRSVRFKSGPALTPQDMVEGVLKITHGWRFSAVSIGYPGVVRGGAISLEPYNLGAGWVGFDFKAAFKHPVKLINDAAMQALGAYRGGTMLFLGLGTGLGSTMIVDGAIVPMELGHLPYRNRHTFEEQVGERARKRLGNKRWRQNVEQVLSDLRQALMPDYIVIGGGNVKHLRALPARTRRGGNADAFTGGFRLWEPGRVLRRPRHR